MSKIKGSRLLRKLIPGMFVGTDSDGNPTVIAGNPVNSPASWQIVNVGAIQWVVWRGYFDLAGISSEQLTTAVLGASLQESASFSMGNPDVGGSIRCYDILSKQKILDSAFDDDKFSDPVLGTWCAPGFLESDDDLEDILFGSYRRFAPDTNITAGTIKIDQTSWGSGSATAGDKIHITRAIPMTGMTSGGAMTVPSAAYVVPVSYVDEKDLVYLERLRRSYALANQP